MATHGEKRWPPAGRSDGRLRGDSHGRRHSDVTLRHWLKEEKASRGERPGGLSSDEREELARLRDENATLRMEREILRKAAVFFAREDDGR
jgi:transposase-like protein